MVLMKGAAPLLFTRLVAASLTLLHVSVASVSLRLDGSGSENTNVGRELGWGKAFKTAGDAAGGVGSDCNDNGECGVSFNPLYLLAIVPFALGLLKTCSGCDGESNRIADASASASTQRKIELVNMTAAMLWLKAMLVVMIRVMLADGRLEESEISTIQRIFHAMSDMEVDEKDILSIAEQADTGGSIQEDLEPFVEVLTSEGKDKVLTAMIEVAYADGKVVKSEHELIVQAAETIGVSKDHLKKITQKTMFRIRAVQKAEKEAGKKVPPTGATVMLTGLTAFPEDNGRTGVVTGFVPKSGRCTVQLRGKDEEDAPGNIKAVKLSNLEQVPPSDASST